MIDQEKLEELKKKSEPFKDNGCYESLWKCLEKDGYPPSFQEFTHAANPEFLLSLLRSYEELQERHGTIVLGQAKEIYGLLAQLETAKEATMQSVNAAFDVELQKEFDARKIQLSEKHYMQDIFDKALASLQQKGDGA